MQTIPNKAFTIMELMTVVIIVGVIAVFAIPNFTQTMDQSYSQDAVTQLTTIHAAERIYKAQNGTYWPTDNANHTLAEINGALGLSILANGMTYTCTSPDGAGATFSCSATK